MKRLLLFLLLNCAFSCYCMEEAQKEERSIAIVSEKPEETFGLFSSLDAELWIYTLNIILSDIVENNPKAIKALKKALSFVNSIKTVNSNFNSYKNALYIQLKEKMVQKFVPVEFATLDQDQKDRLLQDCLSSAEKFRTCDQDSILLEAELAKFHSQSVQYILAGANPKIVVNHIVNSYKNGHSCSNFDSNFFSQPLFIAICYGAKLDTILGSSDDNEKFDVKTFIISWATEHATEKLFKVIKLILKSNFDPNSKVYGRGANWKLLHIVAFNRTLKSSLRLKLIELLLQFGAKKDLRIDPQGKKKDGYTACELAEIAGHNEILDILRPDKNSKKSENRCLVS